MPVSDIAFTPAVKARQEQKGSRASYARMEQRAGWRDRLTPDIAAFIAERDSFYLATVSSEGQPYIQHRGGPKGFLKMLDDKTLAFADFAGNKQYITLGNLDGNDRASMFLMDYANRQRIKVWGRARVVEDDPNLLERLSDPDYKAKPERAILFTVDALDVNCRQHITPRYDQPTIEKVTAALRQRVADLEAALAVGG